MPLFANNAIIKGLQSKAIAAINLLKTSFKPWFPWGKSRQQKVYKFMVLAELPKKLRDDVLYVVEEDGFQEQAAMICPCGCGQVLHMNLLDDERPCWKVTVDANHVPSLHPSVWRQVGCKSHFWFKNGKVQFV